MATKRSATTDLNHDNWDNDEEPEERGTYKRASKEELHQRIIKTARRRNPISSVRTGDEEQKNSAFAGFTAFQNTPPAQNFSFLNNLSNTADSTKMNGLSAKNQSKTVEIVTKNTTTSRTITETSNSSNNGPATFSFGKVNSTENKVNNVDKTDENKKSDKYVAQLKGLNESVAKWINKKVEDNPFISLSPIFKDYERYLDEIEVNEKTASSVKPTMQAPDSTSSTDKVVKSNQNKVEEKVPQFSFGSSNLAAPLLTGAKSTFSFGAPSNNTAQTKTPLISFGSTTPASAASAFSTPSFTSSEDQSQKPNENEEENDEPPKPEFTPVVEKDHVYSIRCKVFVKKDTKYGDRGVGNLYLKPIEGSEKVQLIVRADTNLGNLLLNFVLSSNIPTKRMGKKDVMLVCLPMPDEKPPPVPILLRVKSEEEANKLLETLEKHKK